MVITSHAHTNGICANERDSLAEVGERRKQQHV